MRRVRFLLIVLALTSFGGACREDAIQASVAIGAPPNVHSFDVEVAATKKARATGLMRRESVPAGTGMLFLFPKPVRGGFWMKNTLVDLDIAFISEGRVIEVRRMTPCRADPCPLTIPSSAYDWALETAAGGLDGVEPGAPVTVTGNLPSAS